MARHHLVRVGTMGQTGRFAAVELRRYPRGTRVVVRTRRGLELGLVLAPPGPDMESAQDDGVILRAVTAEDNLLQTRLEEHRQSAYDACVKLLAEHKLDATLLDVEPLFDGQHLFFYFLGDVPSEIEPLMAELAEAYETKAQLRKFAETLLTGCGPGCGTDEASGNCDSCTSCAVVGACGGQR